MVSFKYVSNEWYTFNMYLYISKIVVDLIPTHNRMFRPKKEHLRTRLIFSKIKANFSSADSEVDLAQAMLV